MSSWIMQVIQKGAQVVQANPLVAKLIPQSLDHILRKRFFTVEYVLHLAEVEMSGRDMPPESKYESPYPFIIGIIKDPLFYYTSYILACRELKVSYKTVDIFASDWVNQIRDSGCDAFVVWPGEFIQEWKRLYDERLRFLTIEMKEMLYPSYDSLWLYGSKQRQRDWMDIKGFPHPEAWVFYNRGEAMDFIKNAKLPLVVKLDIGATASGVWILNSFQSARKFVENAFSKGIIGKRADLRSRQWRFLQFQEFIPEIREWRIIRIGDSYFGHEKGKTGEFHSGSDVVGWFAPPRKALDMIHTVTETGGFRSMAMDVFETPDGNLLINELQSVFGSVDTAQMYIDGIPGRYKRVNGEFVFDEGHFCKNASCNLRIEDLLGLLSHSTVSI